MKYTTLTLWRPLLCRAIVKGRHCDVVCVNSLVQAHTVINATQNSWVRHSRLCYQENLLRYKKPSRAIKAWHSPNESICDRLMNEQIIQLHPLRTVVIVSHQKSKHIYPFLPAVRSIKVKGYIVNWMLMWTNINHQFIVRLSSEVGRAAPLGTKMEYGEEKRPISIAVNTKFSKAVRSDFSSIKEYSSWAGSWGVGKRWRQRVLGRVGPLHYVEHALLWKMMHGAKALKSWFKNVCYCG